MLISLFIILMFIIFGKLLFVAFKAAWGISKIILTLVLLPAVIIVMAIGGLITIAIPILIIVGVITAFCCICNR